VERKTHFVSGKKRTGATAKKVQSSGMIVPPDSQNQEGDLIDWDTLEERGPSFSPSTGIPQDNQAPFDPFAGVMTPTVPFTSTQRLSSHGRDLFRSSLEGVCNVATTPPVNQNHVRVLPKQQYQQKEDGHGQMRSQLSQLQQKNQKPAQAVYNPFDL
jgi:hypothetical protein